MHVELGLHQRLERLLFDREHPLPALAERALHLLRYPYALARDLWRGELNLRAMGLVYTTLFALVPLGAFAFAVLKGLGVHRDLEPLLYEFLSPLGAPAFKVTAEVMHFIDNASGGVLGALGVAFLLLSVLSAVQKVEESFNFAWHVDRPRSFMRRAAEYLSLMVIAPIFLVVTFGLINALDKQDWLQWLAAHEPFGTLLLTLGKLGPYLFVTAVFSFLYAFVPNTRVRTGAAVGGGLVAGFLWTASGAAFAHIVAASAQMVAIYAGFAIFLVALIWIYLSWLILLLGAQLSFYLQQPHYLRAGQSPVHLTSCLRERLALSVMLLVARDFAAGRRQWRLDSLAERLELPTSALARVVDSLEKAGLLITTEDEFLLPGRDPAGIGLHAILTAVRDERQYESWLLYRARTEPEADALADSIEAAIRERTAGATLTDAVTGAPIPRPQD
jgi:membrane protein